jgi:hypothetical protein
MWIASAKTRISFFIDKDAQMKIIAKKVKARHLMPGDLFSVYNQETWNDFMTRENKEGLKSVGQLVYIRTDAKCPDEEKDDILYRIRIERK